MQLALSFVTFVIVVLLEWRFRTVGWRTAAESSPWFPLGVDFSLGIHIAFAIAMVVGWIGALTLGIRGWVDGALARGNTLRQPACVHRVGSPLRWLADERQAGAVILGVELADEAVRLADLPPARGTVKRTV
jgi:hypothetical protein